MSTKEEYCVVLLSKDGTEIKEIDKLKCVDDACSIAKCEAIHKLKSLLKEKFGDTQFKSMFELLTDESVQITDKTDDYLELIQNESKYFPFGYMLAKTKPDESLVIGYEILEVKEVEPSIWKRLISPIFGYKKVKQIEISHWFAVKKKEKKVSLLEELKEVLQERNKRLKQDSTVGITEDDIYEVIIENEEEQEDQNKD